MLGPAHVEVDRQPVVDLVACERRRVVMGRRVAQVIPRGAHERVHGVGLAPRRAAAARAGRAHPGLVARQRRARVVGRVEVLEVGQQHGELVGRHRHLAARVAVDDRDRRAPVPLAADQPVAQLVVDLLARQPLLAQPGDDRLERLARRRHAVEAPGVHHHTVARVRLGERALGARRRRDHLDDRQTVLGGELEVALVVCRHGHDGAGAVAHQHVVADPDGDLEAVHRVDRGGAGEHAALLLLGRQALDLALAPRLVLVGGDGRPLLRSRQLVDQRVLGRQDHVRGAEQRVGPRREHGQRLIAAGQGEIDLGALAASDPVRLHQPDTVGPVDRRQVVEQPLRVVGDAQVPLLEVDLGDLAAATPAAALLDLFVGEDGLVGRAPPLLAGRLVGQPPLVHEQEEPLCPAVVVRLAAGDLARPVERKPDHVHLAVVVGDVARGGDRRVHAQLDGVVLGRQAEGVPAHRVQDVVAAHSVETRDRVGGHVVAAVADREAVARRVREEVETVELGLVRDVGRKVSVTLAPDGLPALLDLVGVVAFHAVPCCRWARREI